jgi:hypothetical protein
MAKYGFTMHDDDYGYANTEEINVNYNYYAENATIGDHLEHFKSFLQSCGYAFGIDDTLIVLKVDDEFFKNDQ